MALTLESAAVEAAEGGAEADMGTDTAAEEEAVGGGRRALNRPE